MQATAHALAGRREQMERFVAEAFALANGHPDVAGQVWGNARGLGSLLQEERTSALAALNEAVNFLRDPRCTVPGGIIGPLWGLLHTLIDDVSNVKGEGFAIKYRLHGENFVVDDKIWTARVDGELLGLPGHGRRIHVRVLHVFEFRGGLICRENVWLDGAAVIAQLTGTGILASDPARET